MSPTFTDDDVGKSIETATGDHLGVVADTDPETAYVVPAESVTDSTRAALEWDRGTDETVPLTDDAVEEITDDAITLESDFPTETITSASTADDESGSEPTDSDARSDIGGRGSGDHDPGEPVASNPTEPAPDDGPTAGTDPDVSAASEPMVEDDGFYDTPEADARVDPDAEMEPPAEENRESEGYSEPEGSVDESEEDSSQGGDVDVDLDEVTEGDPEVDLEPGEDVGRRDQPGSSRSAGDDSGDSSEE
ncbi:hypothetical protein [Natronorubrum daqingense]|uniref:Uncharacterized protein n=1 Tax=Natronorubrum daqingense TaxID=588898 RepID=A0A1N7ENN4_9EURY|nr:hypothetical protein [Natronorubrum daqingense]APX97839.1 hypothetical protein BB347_15105 [Natronorubrum daqingense]SIR89669.1 hypothetical protein SAMN05421809_2732 [Natronorubrum daqingense]